MTSRYQKATSAVALFLILAISQVYVRANLIKPDRATKNGAPTVAPVGKLTVGGVNPISLNGNNVDSGATIYSGAHLRTPDKVAATVQLGSVTALDMSPNTDLTLTFDKGNVAVNLTAGRVVLTTDKGTIGSVTIPGGRIERTDSSKISSISVAAGVDAAQDRDDKDRDKDPGDRRFGGLGKANFFMLIAGAAAAVIIPIEVHRIRKHNRCRRKEREEENPSEVEPDDDEDCEGVEGFHER